MKEWRTQHNNIMQPYWQANITACEENDCLATIDALLQTDWRKPTRPPRCGTGENLCSIEIRGRLVLICEPKTGELWYLSFDCILFFISFFHLSIVKVWSYSIRSPRGGCGRGVTARWVSGLPQGSFIFENAVRVDSMLSENHIWTYETKWLLLLLHCNNGSSHFLQSFTEN